MQVSLDSNGKLLLEKHQTQLTPMDDKIHCLYVKGIRIREILLPLLKKCMMLKSLPPIPKVTDGVGQLSIRPVNG